MQKFTHAILHSRLTASSRTIALLLFSTFTGCSSWSITKPVDSIPDKPLHGKLYGRDFVADSTTWNNVSLTFKSGNESMPDAEVMIWSGIKKLTDEVVVTPEATSAVHIWTKYKRPGDTSMRSMQYSHGYSMRITPVTIGGTEIKAKIHLSFPDYQHSYLVGTFTARTQIPRLMNSGFELKVTQGTSSWSTETPERLVPAERFRQNLGSYAVFMTPTELGGNRFALSVSLFSHSDLGKELFNEKVEGVAPDPLEFSFTVDDITVAGAVFVGAPK